jgi:hypothetical protein
MHGGLEMPPLPLVPFGSILAAGLSLSAAPHVSAADTLSIASGLNPDIRYTFALRNVRIFLKKNEESNQILRILLTLLYKFNKVLDGFGI